MSDAKAFRIVKGKSVYVSFALQYNSCVLFSAH